MVDEEIQDAGIGEGEGEGSEAPKRRGRPPRSESAEIASLKAELDAKSREIDSLKKSPRATAGGVFTCQAKHVQPATVRVQPGEYPEDVYREKMGIFSTPHRIEVHEEAEDAPIGKHEGGVVVPFIGTPTNENRLAVPGFTV